MRLKQDEHEARNDQCANPERHGYSPAAGDIDINVNIARPASSYKSPRWRE
jgi:hypothetical protein